MELNDKFTILVGTCDKYSFIWEEFSTLFNRYWDKDLNVKKYFLGETVDKSIDGFGVLKPGKIPYSDCLSYGLNSVTTPYVLWLQDDYFLRKKINKEKFEYYFDFIEKNNVDRFGIKDDSKYYTKSHISDEIWKIDPKSQYTISMQASIWNVDYFKKCLKSNETPWQFELNGTPRINNNNMSNNIYFELQSSPWYLEAMKKGAMTDNYYKIKDIEKL